MHSVDGGNVVRSSCLCRRSGASSASPLAGRRLVVKGRECVRCEGRGASRGRGVTHGLAVTPNVVGVRSFVIRFLFEEERNASNKKRSIFFAEKQMKGREIPFFFNS